MKKNHILIEFSAVVAEIINRTDSKCSNDDYFQWAAWHLDANIINLLRGQSYLNQRGHKKYANYLVGWQMSAHKDIEYCAEQYFQCVFEHPISNRKRLPVTPCDKLQNTIRANCLDREKRQENNLSPISLWGIFERAGQPVENNSQQQLCYRYWHGEDLRKLKIHLYDVLSTANRHYAEIYRLGLYPPDFIDSINVSQARQLNAMIKAAKQRTRATTQHWRSIFSEVWAEKPMKKIGTDKIANYDDFANHDIGKCLLGTARATLKMLTYDELSASEDGFEDYIVAEVAELSQEQQDHEAGFYADLDRLTRRLNTADLDPRDKELIFNIIHQRDIDTLIDKDENEDKLFEHLHDKIMVLLSDDYNRLL